MATITIPGMFLTGDHASRPAANTVGKGSLYACSTHDLIYQSDASSWATWYDPTAGAAAAISVAIIADHKAQNTAGGTFTSGAWQTRVLQTEVSDADSLVTISSNQFTPIAGTYLIRASAPAYSVDNHQTRLQNITAGSTTLTGTTEYSRSTASAQNQTRSFVVGRFTANGTDAYELQHRCGTTKSTDGMGTQANLTTEVYAQVELTKVG